MDAAKFPPWNKIDAQLSAPVLSFVADKLGFTGAAPVQATVIPLLCRGKDCVVEAITGSGKTLAFLIPAAELLLTSRVRDVCTKSRHSVVVLCLFPTRELANQVHTIARDMIAHLNKVIAAQHKALPKAQQQQTETLAYAEACFVGGHAVTKDVAAFQDKGGHLLLGTPGRLNELLVTSKESVCFDLRNLEMLILDEADRLLECGFRPTVDSLLKRLPKQRRTALFSATQSRELADLARAGCRNPLLVTVKENPAMQRAQQQQQQQQQSKNADGKDDEDAANMGMQAQVPSRLTNRYFVTRYADKLDALMAYLRPVVHDSKILIYVITCASVEWLHSALSVLLSCPDTAGSGSGAPPPLYALHGQLSMDQRKKVHRQAGAPGKAATIICSDVAARGLDLPNVRHVIQFDAPTDPRTFVHRIGRTARMGQAGDSLLLLAPLERDYIPFLEMQNVAFTPFSARAWTKMHGGGGAGAEAEGDGDEEEDIFNEDNDEDEGDAAEGADARVDRHRTMQSVMAERLKLKAARGRSQALAKRRHAVQQKHRAVVTRGDLCESPCILALRRAAALHGNTVLMQRSARAFVSFIRAYKEHECRNIFRLQYIDITDLTNGFALFFVPNCGEIRMMSTLRIPLQDEFTPFVARLNEQRKEAHAARAAAAAAAAEEENGEAEGQQQQHHHHHQRGGAPAAASSSSASASAADADDAAEHGRDDDDDDDDASAGRVGKEAKVQRRQLSVHEITRAEKQRVRDSNMSQAAKSRAWKAIDQAELFRDYHLVRKENRGKMSREQVDEMLGLNAMDNAHMSSRERKQRRRARSN